MDAFSSHHGVINLFPVAFGLISDDAKLENALRFASDEEELFSPYGLRGVSKRDEEYIPGTGYWRGPVWVSVNYLVLRGLHLYYEDNSIDISGTNDKISSTKDLYKELRRNHLKVVYDNWAPQHLFYENFNDVTGRGQYSHPFSGWTTLVLLILQEKYI